VYPIDSAIAGINVVNRVGLSTIISSQVPRKRFHDYIHESTHADAICDRLIQTAHRLLPPRSEGAHQK